MYSTLKIDGFKFKGNFGCKRPIIKCLKLGEQLKLVCKRKPIVKHQAPPLTIQFDSEDDMELGDQDDQDVQAEQEGFVQQDVLAQTAQGSHGAQDVPCQLGEDSVFYTTKPEAGLRDVLIIECHKINGELKP